MSTNWGEVQNGEVDKKGHPYFTKDSKKPIPDFLIHEPGSGNNYAVIEVKSCDGIAKNGSTDDIEKLLMFLRHGYTRAIYLIYGKDAAKRARDAQNNCKQLQKCLTQTECKIEIWYHPASKTPASPYRDSQEAASNPIGVCEVE